MQDLGSDTSPQTLTRCAEFLVSHKQFEKAIGKTQLTRVYLRPLFLFLLIPSDGLQSPVTDSLFCTTQLDTVGLNRLSLSLFNLYFFYRHHDPCTHALTLCHILELYVMAKRFNQAVEMCLDHKVSQSPSLPQYIIDAEYVLTTVCISTPFFLL